MRRVRLSRNFVAELASMLAEGTDRFGASVADRTRARVRHTIENVLAHNPKRPIDPSLGLCTYHVARTPFTLLYDYDDAEPRIHLIIYARADWTKIDLSSVDW